MTHNNLRYYKTKLLPRQQTVKNKRALVSASTDLLCIKNNVYTEQTWFAGRKLKPSCARYFDNGETKMLVIYNELTVDAFAETIYNMDVEGKILIYVFSNTRYAYDDNFEDVLDKVELCALPAAIYDAYRNILPEENLMFEEPLDTRKRMLMGQMWQKTTMKLRTQIQQMKDSCPLIFKTNNIGAKIYDTRKRYQIEAVETLVKKTLNLLESDGDRKKLVFKAPTGSGKTVMSSKVLDELTSQLAEEGKQVAIIWIAPNKLHQQSYMSMRNFFSETHVLTPVMCMMSWTTRLVVTSSQAKCSLSTGRASTRTRISWCEIQRTLLPSLQDIVERTKNEHHLPLIVVIDEEHMFGSRNAKQSEKVLKNLNPKVEIRISATPQKTSLAEAKEIVIVPREDVIREEMIKDGITINAGVEKMTAWLARMPISWIWLLPNERN